MPANSPLSLLIDVNFILINRFLVLAATLLFFCGVAIVHRSRGQKYDRRVTSPIRLALFGMLLLYGEIALSSFPRYRELLEGFQTVVVLLCLAKLVIYLLVDIYLRLHLQREVPSFIRDSIRLLVYLAVGIVSLRLVFKIDLGAIVTTTTVITATIAFAMQSTLTNALSGFSIQTDALLKRQNWISIKEKNIFGEIVNVGFRYTTLRNPENNLIMVPNSVIMQNIITFHGNGEYDDKPAITADIALGYDLPPEAAKQLLLKVVQDEQEILATPEPLVRLFSYNDSSITYQLKFWIAEPQRKIPVQDSVYSRAWYAVHRAGHSFPFPHRQIIATTEQVPFNFSRELIIKKLRKSDLFGILDEATLQSLVAQVPVRVYGGGEAVVIQGNQGSSLFLVLRGNLAASIDGTVVGSIEEDSFFGEMSLLTGAPRGATVRATCEVWLAEITNELMEPLLRENQALLETISAILAERSRRTSESLSDPESGTTVTSRQDDYLKRLKQFFKL